MLNNSGTVSVVLFTLMNYELVYDKTETAKYHDSREVFQQKLLHSGMLNQCYATSFHSLKGSVHRITIRKMLLTCPAAY